MSTNGMTRLRRVLIGSVAAALIGFLGLVLFVDGASRRLEELDRRIVDDAAPSVLTLQSGSLALSEMLMHLRDRLGRVTRHPELLDAQIAADRRILEDDLRRYLGLPQNPGEPALHAEIQAAHLELERVVDRILAAPPGFEMGQAGELRAALDEATTALQRPLLRAAKLNADIEIEATDTLRSVRRSLLPGALALEIASLAAAAIALAAAFRMSRRALEAGEQSRRLLERRASELDAFSGRVAHDLMSPLMNVGVALGLAERRLASEEDARLRDFLARAEGSLGRVRQMCADLLEFARAGAVPVPGAEAEPARVLPEVVGDLAPLAEQAGVELRLEIATDRRVRCAEGVLTSMTANLVQNALKHAAGSTPRHVSVRAADAGPDVRVEVEDDGPGVPAEEREAIFLPYVRGATAAASGLGLGLATVRRLVEAHGGHVGLEGEHGARFWFTLPARA